VRLGLEQKQWRRRRTLLRSKKNKNGLKEKRRGILRVSKKSRIWSSKKSRIWSSKKSRFGLEGRQRRLLPVSETNRIGFDGWQRRTLRVSKKSRIGIGSKTEGPCENANEISVDIFPAKINNDFLKTSIDNNGTRPGPDAAVAKQQQSHFWSLVGVGTRNLGR
jgi:hypothetical protein